MAVPPLYRMRLFSVFPGHGFSTFLAVSRLTLRVSRSYPPQTAFFLILHSASDGRDVLGASLRHSQTSSEALERFQNSRALFRAVKGGILLRKMPLGSGGSGDHQSWNRCTPRTTGTRSWKIHVAGPHPVPGAIRPIMMKLSTNSVRLFDWIRRFAGFFAFNSNSISAGRGNSSGFRGSHSRKGPGPPL
jgi:hypothetical protein